MLAEPLLVVTTLAGVFDALGVRYVVGGSLASSIHGVPRATQDVDLVAELEPSHAEPLFRRLEPSFHVDLESVRDSIMGRSSFNAIHLATMFKADIFVARADEWSRLQLERARIETLETPSGPRTIRFASAEDTLVHKLRWYRLGNEISDRQWRDILGILTVQGEDLGSAYLDHAARLLGVEDLLRRARSDAGATGRAS